MPFMASNDCLWIKISIWSPLVSNQKIRGCCSDNCSKKSNQSSKPIWKASLIYFYRLEKIIYPQIKKDIIHIKFQEQVHLLYCLQGGVQHDPYGVDKEEFVVAIDELKNK